MRREVYEEYIRIIDAYLKVQGDDGSLEKLKAGSTAVAFDRNLLADYDSNSLVVTVKNYNMPNGLSRGIHEST